MRSDKACLALVRKIQKLDCVSQDMESLPDDTDGLTDVRRPIPKNHGERSLRTVLKLRDCLAAELCLSKTRAGKGPSLGMFQGVKEVLISAAHGLQHSKNGMYLFPLLSETYAREDKHGNGREDKDRLRGTFPCDGACHLLSKMNPEERKFLKGYSPSG